MNIKSFFNGTVLKKDLTRFWPLWVIYLILGLLILMTTMGEMYFSVAETAAASLGWLSVVTMIYALITAQMLFGELFQSKLCNAIHALPVRREGLFLTHFAAGLIMHLGPNLAIALVGMLGLGRLWFVALLWWLALTLQYLIFFGMAVFCMHCAGNRFAGVALYVLVNFVSLVVMVFFELIYLPMLYGIEMTDTLRSIFYLFSPVVNLAGGGPWLVIEHSSHCPVLHYTSYDMVHTCSYYLKEFGDIWGYAIIAAVVGIGFAVAAFFIYRKRHMESAGDFVSFKPMGTVFTLMASATLGLALHAIVPTAGMIVGALVGFFVCRMLLERTIKVFNKKSWLYLIGLCLFIGLTLVLTAWDVGGVASRIPDAEDVESVTIADHRLSDWRLDDLNDPESLDAGSSSQVVTVGVDPYYKYGSDGVMTLTAKKQIDDIREIHRLLIEEGDSRKNGDRNYFTITVHYRLKNGATITRYYYTAHNSPAMERLQQYTSTPRFILGYDTPEEMAKYLRHAYYSGLNHPDGLTIEDPVWLEKLAAALFADAQAGVMTPNHGDYESRLYLEFEYEDRYHSSQSIGFDYLARNTLACLMEYEIWFKENGKLNP